MMEVIKKQNEAAQQKVLPFTERFYNFWMLKKRRFFYVFMVGWMYKYDWANRIRNWTRDKRDAYRVKFTTRWTSKWNPQEISHAKYTKEFHVQEGDEGV